MSLSGSQRLFSTAFQDYRGSRPWQQHAHILGKRTWHASPTPCTSQNPFLDLATSRDGLRAPGGAWIRLSSIVLLPSTVRAARPSSLPYHNALILCRLDTEQGLTAVRGFSCWRLCAKVSAVSSGEAKVIMPSTKKGTFTAKLFRKNAAHPLFGHEIILLPPLSLDPWDRRGCSSYGNRCRCSGRSPLIAKKLAQSFEEINGHTHCFAGRPGGLE